MHQSCCPSNKTIFSGYDKENVRSIYPIRKENESHYFKWNYNCFFGRAGVKSHLIEEGTYKKSYPPELRAFSKSSDPNRHFIRTVSSTKKIKRKQNNKSSNIKINNRAVLHSFSLSRKQGETRNCSFFGAKFMNCISI